MCFTVSRAIFGSFSDISIEDDGMGIDLTADGLSMTESGEHTSLVSGHGLALLIAHEPVRVRGQSIAPVQVGAVARNGAEPALLG